VTAVERRAYPRVYDDSWAGESNRHMDEIRRRMDAAVAAGDTLAAAGAERDLAAEAAIYRLYARARGAA